MSVWLSYRRVWARVSHHLSIYLCKRVVYISGGVTRARCNSLSLLCIYHRLVNTRSARALTTCYYIRAKLSGGKHTLRTKNSLRTKLSAKTCGSSTF